MPKVDELPTPEGGAEKYKAAGKLKGKRAIITGGDSGIGRSIAVLFAMEGADSFIAYLPEEEKDAQDTKKMVEEKGQKCHTLAVNLKSKENCQKVIDEAVKAMGGIDILINNHAYQMMTDDIHDLSEYVHHSTFSCVPQLTIMPGNNGSTPLTQTSTPSSSSQSTPCPT